MEGELYKAIQWLYLGWIYEYDIYHIHISYKNSQGEFWAVSGHRGWINGVSNDMTGLK